MASSKPDRMSASVAFLARGVVLLMTAWTSLLFAQDPDESRPINLQLLDAARSGDAATVERLLHEGASVKTRNRVGATPLFQAAREGHADIVRTLLKAGADVDQPNLELTTPLMQAAHNGHLEAATALLEAGADVNHVDQQLLTPLM